MTYGRAFTEPSEAEATARQLANPAAKSVAKNVAKSQQATPSRTSAGSLGKGRCKTGRDQRGSHGRRLVANLQRDEDALTLLRTAGLDAGTASAIGLGMRDPYVRSDGQMVSGVLSYPVSRSRGRIRFGSLNLPGYTTNPEHPVGWSAGPAEGLSYGTGEVAVVCSSALEAWLAWQAAQSAGVSLTALASTHPDAMPSAWRQCGFWTGWSRVVVTDGTSRSLAAALAISSARPIERCPSSPSSGTEPVDAGDLADWIDAIFDGERRLIAAPPGAEVLLPGDYAASRMSLHGGLHEGRMYYAFAVERREAVGHGSRLMFSYRTLVVRSDGAVLEPMVLSAPAGTPADRLVHALSDGTRIAAGSRSPVGASWSLAAIKRFVGRARAGLSYDGPSGAVLRGQLVAHLRSVVWLPEQETIDKIADFVMATYFYRHFDAFPILYVHGPRATGKSELTSAAVAMSFNGSLMAQGSGAALIGLARDSGGLIAIDDAETLTAGFGELAQALKVGYKASTGVKRMVGSSGAVETVDFFGPRILCNTRGLDDVLQSRCITIATAPRPEGCSADAGNDLDIAAWRDAMHDFAMSHVTELSGVVASRRASVNSRDAELMLPLNAVRELIASGV